MSTPDTSILIFNKYLPSSTVRYCHSLWLQYKFRFIVSPKRETKLGDYRFEAEKGHHIITVNGNLNPLSFLTTYIHEIAHLVAFKKYGGKVLPHGKEWKHEFRELFQPLLNETIIPREAVVTLQKYLSNPKASSCSEHGLFDSQHALELKPGESIVQDLKVGQLFSLKKRSFKMLEQRRTRALCLDVNNGRKYLVPLKSVVSII